MNNKQLLNKVLYMENKIKDVEEYLTACKYILENDIKLQLKIIKDLGVEDK